MFCLHLQGLVMNTIQFGNTNVNYPSSPLNRRLSSGSFVSRSSWQSCCSTRETYWLSKTINSKKYEKHWTGKTKTSLFAIISRRPLFIGRLPNTGSNTVCFYSDCYYYYYSLDEPVVSSIGLFQLTFKFFPWTLATIEYNDQVFGVQLHNGTLL